MSRHRGYFSDESQSLNLFMEGATMAKLTSMHFYAWKSGLKTGMYYLRTKSAVDAIKFTGDKEVKKAPVAVEAQEVLVQPVSPVGLPKQAMTDEAKPDTEPMSPDELKAIIAQAKDSEGDDCLMCGS